MSDNQTFSSSRQSTFFSSLVFFILAYLISFSGIAEGSSNLHLQDVNILVVTDVHSWLAGHKHEPYYDVNYGHVLSFYERLRDICYKEQKDLFFVMNGDFIDGTGLTTYPPIHLTPLLEMMPWDLVNIGNHELYKNSTVNHIIDSGFVDSWNGGYLTSNTILVETQNPIGSRFKLMHGNHEAHGGVNSTILAFGFLFNFENHCESSDVEIVEEVIESNWFEDVLKDGGYDAIIVLAHMGSDDPLVEAILSKIRQISECPVQFITGHTHLRKNRTLDDFSESFEAGHFLDTIGFSSFSIGSNSSFKHTFIDANVNALKWTLGISSEDELMTPSGIVLSDMIQSTRSSLGLFDELGCAPKTYFLSKALDEESSLWGLYAKDVVPTQLFDGNSDSKLYLQNPGAFRYDLFKGVVQVEDLVTMSPYNDTIIKMDSPVFGSEFVDAFGQPNYLDESTHHMFMEKLPQFVVSGDIIVEMDKQYEVFTVEFDTEYVKTQLENVTNREFTTTRLDEVTTGTLWKEFFTEKWDGECVQILEESTPWDKIFDFFEEFTWLKIIAFLLSFMVVLFFGWMFLCRNVRKHRLGSKDAEDDLSFFEDSGLSDDEDTYPNRLIQPHPLAKSYQHMHAESNKTIV